MSNEYNCKYKGSDKLEVYKSDEEGLIFGIDDTGVRNEVVLTPPLIKLLVKDLQEYLHESGE
mgnify:CR=1 FL=1